MKKPFSTFIFQPIRPNLEFNFFFNEKIINKLGLLDFRLQWDGELDGNWNDDDDAGTAAAAAAAGASGAAPC